MRTDQPNTTAGSRCLSILTIFVVVASLLINSLPVMAQDRFTEAELDQLLSPVALYPDPLLAQVIPASTFVEQIQEAESVLNGKTDESLISNRNWDVSVKAVAHYPQVLEMMSTQPDWTASVGQAYVNQSTDVGKSIQRLRAEARSSGALVTTPQQQVVIEKEVIKIVPAQAQVIYVPQYDPQVVYVEKDDNDGVSTGAAVAATAIAFGAGLAIGAWMNRDWDWYGPGPYYHGWAGGGWIGSSRSYVNINNNIYVNRNFNNINVNRNVINRNTTNFRADINNRVRNNQRLDINRAGVSRDRNGLNTGDRLGNPGNNARRVNNRNLGDRSGISKNKLPASRSPSTVRPPANNSVNRKLPNRVNGSTANRPNVTRPNVPAPKPQTRSAPKPNIDKSIKDRPKLSRPQRQARTPRRRG
jgi:hypothetical protein